MSANVETKNTFLIGHSSFFDKNPIKFSHYPKNHHLLGNLKNNKKVKRMISISKGWYTINKQNSDLYFNDLRFGTLSMRQNAENFVFKYKINVDENENVTFIEVKKDKNDAKNLMSDLWMRIKGN